MGKWIIPAYTYHWTIVNFSLLSQVLQELHMQEYNIISVSVYGWIWKKALIVYGRKF